MELTLIEGGALYAPEPGGQQSILIVGSKIAKIGAIDGLTLAALDLDINVIDARNCYVTPGFIDPHEHLIGAAGEQGFPSRTPEVPLSELIAAGITTAVGCLGTDTTSRHLTTLLAKTRQLSDGGVGADGTLIGGITAYMYTGGFPVPTPTITGSITDDLVLIDRVIGVGEIAISDFRSSEPSIQELARLVKESIIGGLVGGKAGVTHFHTGPGRGYLAPLHALLDQHEIPAKYLHATHITRSAELMDDAIRLSRRGAFVDMDVIDEDFGVWLKYYREHGGILSQLTVSSDANTLKGKTLKLYGQFVSAIRDHHFKIEKVLPHFTQNVATVLALKTKGRIAPKLDADLLVIDRDSLELRHVIARGEHMLRDGQVIVKGMHE